MSDYIRSMREKLEMDRHEFARAFGLSGYMSVSNIEIGLRNPSKLLLMLLGVLDSMPKKKAQEFVKLMQKHSDIES